MKILSGFVLLLCLSAALAQAETTVTRTDDVSTQGVESDVPDGSIMVNAVHVGDAEMSSEEAFAVLSETKIVSAVDVGVVGTMSENSFAMASVLYRMPSAEALEFFKKLFSEAQTFEARTYALMGLKLLNENYYYKTLGITLDSSALVSVYVNGKLYEINLSKFLNAFARNPSVYVPSSFPEGDESVASSVSLDADSVVATSETHTVIRSSAYVYTDFGSVLYPLPGPIIVVTRPPRPPVHIRPFPPRPHRPVVVRPLPPRPHRPVVIRPLPPKPIRPGVPQPLPPKPNFPGGVKPGIPPRPGTPPSLRPGNRPPPRPNVQVRPLRPRPQTPSSRPQMRPQPRPQMRPQSRPQMRPQPRPQPSRSSGDGNFSGGQFKRK